MHPSFALMRPAQLTWGVRNEFVKIYENVSNGYEKFRENP